MRAALIALVLAGCGGDVGENQTQTTTTSDAAACRCVTRVVAPCVCGWDESKASPEERAYCARVFAFACVDGGN